MSRKGKGMNAERDLIHRFWSSGWASIRVAGSGSMKYPSADILATNKSRKLAIECKSSKGDCKYLTKDDVEQLRVFSELFRAEPWFGVRFDRESWFFVSLDDIDKTENGYKIGVGLAKSRGLLFEELVEK